MKNVITPEDVPKIQEFFADCPVDPFAAGSDYKNVVVDKRLYLPSLEKKLEELFPDMMIFATNFFSGDAANGAYSSWHTGANISKLFVNEPTTFTVWIPLQTLTEETGGRLWYYDGEYLPSVIDLLKVAHKKTMMLQYITVTLMEKELEAHKITEDCHLGDAFMFWELNPHAVDNLCNIKRDVLSVRMISRDAVVDHAFMKELEEFPDDLVLNWGDDKRVMTALLNFLRKTKATYDASLELYEKLKQEQQ